MNENTNTCKEESINNIFKGESTVCKGESTVCKGDKGEKSKKRKPIFTSFRGTCNI